MKKWNLVVDIANCTNCNNCTLACQDEYVGNEFPGYAAEMPKHGHRWIEIHRKERGKMPMVDVAYVPTMCNHCDDAPCMAAAENGAITKRPDGIVLIDPVKSKGQKQIVEACPYGAIWWNEEKQIPQAWPFDAHLLDDGWKEPRCAQVCPTGAIRAEHVEDEEMAKIIEREGLEPLRPDLDTRPRVWYRNLYRYTKAFIGGSLSREHDGVVDCVEGARVALKKDGQVVAEAVSDYFGDFQFDRLDENSGAYEVEIEAEGCDKKTVGAELTASVYLGEIRLS